MFLVSHFSNCINLYIFNCMYFSVYFDFIAIFLEFLSTVSFPCLLLSPPTITTSSFSLSPNEVGLPPKRSTDFTCLMMSQHGLLKLSLKKKQMTKLCVFPVQSSPPNCSCITVQSAGIQYMGRACVSQLLSEIMLLKYVSTWQPQGKWTVMHRWSAGSTQRLCSLWLSAWSKKRPHFTIAPCSHTAGSAGT